MTQITLDQANTVIAGAFRKGAELGLKPLSIVVLDAGGHVVAFQRQERSSHLRFQIATAKASGALALGMSSRKIGDVATERAAFVAAVGALSAQGIVPAAGGVIVVDQNGDPIGAVGATGDTSDNDEHCTLAGIAAAGLTPQAEQRPISEGYPVTAPL